MMEILKDKDIIIAILALGTPIVSVLMSVLNNVIIYFMKRKQKKSERNYSHREEIYTNFLDSVNEIILDNLRLYDEKYYANLIHSFNATLLYAGKETRKRIKELKEYFDECKEKFTAEYKYQGFEDEEEYICEFAEQEGMNRFEAGTEYDKNLENLKLSCISKSKAKSQLEKIIDSMSEELL